MKLLLILQFFFLAQSQKIKRNDQIIFPTDESDENEIFEPKTRISFDEADQNFEFDENLFQGDIKLTKNQEKIFNSEDYEEEDGASVSTRTGLMLERYRWKKNKNGKVLVPYKIREDSGFGETSLGEKVLIAFLLALLKNFIKV